MPESELNLNCLIVNLCISRQINFLSRNGIDN